MSVSQASTPFTLLLGILVALTALGLDMYLPAVPLVAQALGAGHGAAQLTITTYLLGLAIGQLGWGPLADRHGRKPVLLGGLAIFLIASLAGAAANGASALALIRFAQGIGMSSGPVIARSIVRDLYAREQAARLLARMMAVFGIVPAAAPLLGAQAINLAGWTTVFWVFAAIALLLLTAVGFGLRETAPAARPSIAPRRIIANFSLLLGDQRFRAALATMLPAQIGIIAFVSSAALSTVQSLQLTPTEFSLLFAAVMLGQISGGLICSRLAPRLGMQRMVRLGAATALGAGMVFATLSIAQVLHWAAIVLPMIAYIFGCAFMLPNTTAAALSPFAQIAGAASSLLGALPFALGAATSALLGAAFDGTTRPMAITIALCGLASFLGERRYFRRIVHA